MLTNKFYWLLHVLYGGFKSEGTVSYDHSKNICREILFAGWWVFLKTQFNRHLCLCLLQRKATHYIIALLNPFKMLLLQNLYLITHFLISLFNKLLQLGDDVYNQLEHCHLTDEQRSLIDQLILVIFNKTIKS